MVFQATLKNYITCCGEGDHSGVQFLQKYFLNFGVFIRGFFLLF